MTARWAIAALVWAVFPSFPSAALAQRPRVTIVATYSGLVPLKTFTITETGSVTVTATMDKAAAETVTVTISVEPANYNPTDFATVDDYVVSDNKVLTFAPGSLASTGTVTVTGVDDGGVMRLTRRIRVNYASSSNALVEPGGKPSGFFEFLIGDDETHPTKSVVLTPTAISEKGGVAKVTAELSHPTLLGDVLFDVYTGTLPAGAPGRADEWDFVLSDNVRLVVASGETLSTGTVTVTAVDNDVVGPARKRMGVILYNADYVNAPTNPALWSPWSLLTIEEDDPGLLINPTSLTVDEGGSNTYTVALAIPPTGPVTVAITGHSGTDLTLDPSPASLTFLDSDWSEPQTVTVSAGKDDDGEDDAATLLHTASGGGYDAVTASVEVSVTDNYRSESPVEGEERRGWPSITIWTDRLGLPVDEQVRLYWDINPRNDEREYTVFSYLESIDTGARRYLVPRSGGGGTAG
ncbi:MAG: hypothetical protein OXJ37_23215 [Bryobacterales bacterium]|nr:hypothetical protein [Bryobacterales bacterium]